MIFAAALVALTAVAAAARVAARRRRAPALPPPSRSPKAVDVLVPMRDEEENVEECLAALLAGSAPLRIVVLDDNSSDGTGELARRMGAVDPRVSVLTVPQPPAGANGKVHALLHGERSGEAEWVLALDADARPAPDAIGRALAAAELHRLDAVSLAAAQRARGIGEALVTPPVFALLDGLLGDWERVARGGGDPVANGQFFLVRRAALGAIGGYAAILGEPLDDVALARRLAEHGFRCGFWRGGDALEVRMYRGFAGAFRGWRRNLGLILGDRIGLVVAAAAAILAPAAIAVVALELASPVAAALAWSGGALASMALRDGTGSSPAWGLFYPLDALVLAALLFSAAIDRALDLRPAWRGRAVAAGRPADGDGPF